MILSSAPSNEAVMSNVQSSSEFNIKNSAKAFGILSSGLYANKIKAVIRELSCNAVDSHTAAGKGDIPFVVHLPNVLEPWFSVEDFGIGLTHSQVLNIYTTYFESTKTSSNDFIGALGLGSKSPFSYTDNFTVTATKEGIRNIYSAYINNEGVPTIVLMESSETTDINGVKISFSVNAREDFIKFVQEAQEVFLYFKLKPIIKGSAGFIFNEVKYLEKDILPGISTITKTYYQNAGSIAVMGNIGYAIDVPNAEKNLGNLAYLLHNNLELHFEIGELDFQASREGLSYIPATINAIKNKLELLSQSLSIKLEAEILPISNKWERLHALIEKNQQNIWKSPIVDFCKKYPDSMYDDANTSGSFQSKSKVLNVEEIAKLYNIKIDFYTIYRDKPELANPRSVFKGYTLTKNTIYEHEYHLQCNSTAKFVINDIKVGIIERCKYNSAVFKRQSFYLLSPKDKTKAMDITAFYNFIDNPPDSYTILASSLTAKPRITKEAKEYRAVSIVRLAEAAYGSSMVWKAAGKSSDFPDTQTYYYVPVVGYNLSPECTIKDEYTLFNSVRGCGLPKLQGITIYGVRKADIDVIQKKANWINLEEHIQDTLSNLSKNTMSGMALASSRVTAAFRNSKELLAQLPKTSFFYQLAVKLSNVNPVPWDSVKLSNLVNTYNKGKHLETLIEKKVKSFNAYEESLNATYPLLQRCVPHGKFYDLTEVQKYITLVDQQNSLI